MVEFVIYALVGKIIIFLLQKFPKNSLPIIGKYLFREGRFLDKLFGCGLCLGFWIYLGLSFYFSVNLFGEIYVPIVSEIITGAVTTFVVFIFSVGWNSEFQNYVIE